MQNVSTVSSGTHPALYDSSRVTINYFPSEIVIFITHPLASSSHTDIFPSTPSAVRSCVTIRRLEFLCTDLGILCSGFRPYKSRKSGFFTFLVHKLEHFLLILVAVVTKGKSRIDGVLLLLG